jgi:hypothetical protein
VARVWLGLLPARADDEIAATVCNSTALLGSVQQVPVAGCQQYVELIGLSTIFTRKFAPDYFLMIVVILCLHLLMLPTKALMTFQAGACAAQPAMPRRQSQIAAQNVKT